MSLTTTVGHVLSCRFALSVAFMRFLTLVTCVRSFVSDLLSCRNTLIRNLAACRMPSRTMFGARAGIPNTWSSPLR